MAPVQIRLNDSPSLLKAELTEGENLLLTTDDEIKFIATVKDKKIEDIRAVDNTGTLLPVTWVWVGTMEGRKCYECVEVGGKLECYEIKCPVSRGGIT